MSTTVETETDRVRVSKSVETDGAETVVAAFRIASERNEPVEIRLQDSVPNGHNAQFQTKDEHRWTTQDESVTYERRLEPNETVGTAYKWSATGSESYDGETNEPSLEVSIVSPAAAPATDAAVEATAGFTRGASEAVFSFDGLGTGTGATDVTSEASNGVPDASNGVSEASGGASEASETESPTPEERDGEGSEETDDADASESGTSDGETDDDESAVEETAVDETASREEPTPSSADGGADHDDGTGKSIREFSMPDDEVDVDQLIDEERSTRASGEPAVGNQPDEEAPVASRVEDDSATGVEYDFERPETIEVDHELTEPPMERASLDARVRYLQTRFQDMAAYIDAMEEFIDEHGSGQQVLTALTTDMEAVHERLDSIADQQSAIDERLGDTESQLASLEERIETREETVDDSLDAVTSELETMSEAHESVRSDIEELRTFHDTLRDAI